MIKIIKNYDKKIEKMQCYQYLLLLLALLILILLLIA